jgi:DNA-binding transcriptional MerR regulator
MADDLPEKLYYSISEVADYTQVKAHVLRYWESEFPTLRPKKNRAGNRSYRRRDIDEVLAIKRLLYDEGYKIDGARKILREAAARTDGRPSIVARSSPPREGKVAQLRRELADLLEMVRRL